MEMGYFLSLSKAEVSTALDASEWSILLFGLLLVIGIFGEYDKVPKPMAKWPKAVFEIMVMIGVAGELLGDGGVFLFSRQLQRIEGADLQELNRKAEKALADANGAIGKATAASDISGSAKAEADIARGSAAEAGALARGARQEADSFEKDILSAKRQATEAENHLAQALQRAASAEAAVEVERLARAPRILNAAQQARIAAKLKPFANTPYELSVNATPETANLLEAVDAILRAAGWANKESARTDFRTNFTLRSGSKAEQGVFSRVSVNVTMALVGKYGTALAAFQTAFRTEGIDVGIGIVSSDDPSPNNIHVMIGTKE
jgi:hypothetical protein